MKIGWLWMLAWALGGFVIGIVSGPFVGLLIPVAIAVLILVRSLHVKLAAIGMLLALFGWMAWIPAGLSFFGNPQAPPPAGA